MQFNGFKHLISFEQPEAQSHGVLLPLEVSLGLDARQNSFDSNIKAVGQVASQLSTRQV